MPHMQSKGRHNMCQSVKHVPECQTAETVYRISDNTPNQWAEVVKLYRQNKEQRK